MNKLFYLSTFLLMFFVGCVNKDITVVKNKNPVGTFTGRFLYIHFVGTSNKTDTLTANIQVNMNADKTYSVSGDTSTIIAGSHGTYVMDSSAELQFFDQTFPLTGNPKKAHLSGVYQFTFDGAFFSMSGNDALDTVAYKYLLQKN